jgi:hypothetical protein
MASATIATGTYKGMTVAQFVIECDKQISNAVAKSATLSGLSSVCARINTSNESRNTGYLICTATNVALLGYGNSLLQQTVQLENSSILIYPNPSYNQFVIRNGNKFPLEVRLLNVNGQLLENRGKLEPGASMNVGADFIPGIYLVELTGDGTKLIKKLIKQ